MHAIDIYLSQKKKKFNKNKIRPSFLWDRYNVDKLITTSHAANTGC